MEDFFQNPSDKIAVEPKELEAAYIRAMTLWLAKRIAADKGVQWKAEKESELQEKIAEVVATANGLGLATIRIIAIRTNGQKDSRELDVARISKTRSLQ